MSKALDPPLCERYSILRDVDALRAYLDAAEASGEVHDFDLETAIADERARLRARR